MHSVLVLVDFDAPAADTEAEPDGGAGTQTEHGPEDGVDGERGRRPRQDHRADVVRVDIAGELLARVAPARAEAARQLEVPLLGGAFVERALQHTRQVDGAARDGTGSNGTVASRGS